MVGINDYENEKHKFQNTTMQDISQGGGCYTTDVGYICAHFFNMADTAKTQAENFMNKLFGFWGQNIDLSDQDVFVVTNVELHDQEGRNTTIGDPI